MAVQKCWHKLKTTLPLLSDFAYHQNRYQYLLVEAIWQMNEQSIMCHLLCFHVSFWLSHILVCLFYLLPSLCPC